MIALGSNEIGKAYIGGTEIDKMYLGNELVFSNAPEVLPYDAEIEYIGSNSSASGIYQYIDTGIVPQTSYQVHIKIGPITTYPVANSSLFLTSWTTRTFFIQIGSGSPNEVYWQGMNPSAYRTLSNNVNDIICGNGFITVNGTTYSGSNYLRSTTNTIKLFNDSNTRRAVFDLYLFEITNNGDTIASFKPVRVGTEGCLYDTISKQLFHNAGTGAFTLGNDKT